MEFQKPKRLLGLFSRRYSTTTASNTKRPSKTDDHPDVGNSSSFGSKEELDLIRLETQRDVLLEELRLTKESLEKEKKTTHDLNQRLIMKAISIDCQLTEAEERFAQSRAKIDAANQQNKEMSDSLLAVRKENQNLMKRTAALARRDQIQKATIMASNAEIIKLMATVETFQDRFLSLHGAVEAHKQKYSECPEESTVGEKTTDSEVEAIKSPLNPSASDDSATPFEQDQLQRTGKEDGMSNKKYTSKVKEFEAKLEEFNAKRDELEAKQKDYEAKQQAWHVERDDLFAVLAKLKSNNKEIKKKFVQTLKKHQWKWHKEKEKLLKKVGDLEVWLEEKDAELLLTKNALADALRAEHGMMEKPGGIEKTDTFSTLDTADEDSLSTCSSTSLSIAYSLTETSNNLSKSGKDEEIGMGGVFKNRNDDETTLSSVFEPLVIKPSNSFSSTQCLDTPPRSNSSTTDQSSLS